MRQRTLFPLLLLALFLALGVPAGAEDVTPPGWTTTVTQLDGSARRQWYLALITHDASRHVTLLVAPVSAAGREGAGIDGERIERSESGDLHQIALWAEHLRKDAEGWKRPSLRGRPPASSHVVGVVRSLTAGAAVQNAEHGGGRLAVGDLLFIEDVLTCTRESTLGIELMGAEDRWHHRWSKAEILCGADTRVGLRGTSDAIRLYLHEGALDVTSLSAGLRLHTANASYVPEKDTRCLIGVGSPEAADTEHDAPALEQLAVRTGLVGMECETGTTSVVGGTALTIANDGTHRVAPLDETRVDPEAPKESRCARDEALRLVARVQGPWRGQPRNASITLGDDGLWRSYERQPGRSVNKAGDWEPRPGGVLELTYVWTPHRSKTSRTDVYRYLLEGDALVRLRPGGAVFLHAPPRD